MKDQIGISISSESVLQSAQEQIVEEHNMDASSSKITESFPQDITEALQDKDLVSLANALVDSLLMKNVDPSLHMRIALVSMQNRMRLRIVVGMIVEERLSTLQANNAICAENWLKQPGSVGLSGQEMKSGLTQFKRKLWNQSRSAWMERKKNRE